MDVTLRMAPWAAFLTVGTVATAVVMVLPKSPAQDIGYVLVALAGCAAMYVGPRLHHPSGAAAWYLIGAGMTAWVIGGALSIAETWTQNDLPLSPDVIRLEVYPLAAAGVLVFARAKTAHEQPAILLDTAILTTAAGMVSAVFLISPAWATGVGLERWLDVAFPVGNVLLFGVLVRLAYTPGAARLAALVMAAGIAAMLIYQGVGQVLTTLPHIGIRPDALSTQWLFAYVLAGAAALHPAMVQLSSPEKRGGERTHGRQIAGLGIALAAGPLIVGVQYLAGSQLSAGTIALFYVPLVLLITVRMLALVRQVNDQAISDHLTGLPNRRALYYQARARLSDPNVPQALLLLDLDRFKEVNDSLGHQAGDELLVQVAARLRSQLRADDLLVRLGGDEFAILLEGAGQVEAERIAAMLCAGMSEPFDLGELSVHSAASVGIALFPDHGTDLSTLLRRADVAMYRAKPTGGYRMHRGDEDNFSRLRLSEELRAALDEDQLVLHYQPKLDLDTGTTRGVEALVRWQHPQRGLLPPADFLDRVEEVGLMGALTRCVLTKALDQAVVWRAAGRDLGVAVNLSASSLIDVELPAQIAAMLDARGLPASVLQLEITEEFLMADRARARVILTALREAGINISVDDFGTGYSSLSYLRDLPIDELKLDRSFIFPMHDDARAAALVSSTIHLAHSLGLRMVAEGVENQAAYAELARLGCDQAQGFYMSHPLAPDELELWLQGHAMTLATSPTTADCP
ncbi:MAG: putative bifunctional diguanylate cyclase/phosphodiesterase [Cellulomonas sp.]